jgi:hypothetical protein
VLVRLRGRKPLFRVPRSSKKGSSTRVVQPPLCGTELNLNSLNGFGGSTYRRLGTRHCHIPVVVCNDDDDDGDDGDDDDMMMMI